MLWAGRGVVMDKNLTDRNTEKDAKKYVNGKKHSFRNYGGCWL